MPSAECVRSRRLYQKGSTGRTLAEELFGGSWVLMTIPDANSNDNVLNGVSCPAVGACDAVGYYDNGGSPPGSGGDVVGQRLDRHGRRRPGRRPCNGLISVSCLSTASCMSVGTYRTAAGVNQDLIETLTAGAWAVHHPSPDANGAQQRADRGFVCGLDIVHGRWPLQQQRGGAVWPSSWPTGRGP